MKTWHLIKQLEILSQFLVIKSFFITNINLFTEHKFLLVVSPIFPISIPISKLFLLVTSHFFSSEKFCPQYFISIPLPRAISPSWHSSFFQFPPLFLPDLINVSWLYLYFPDILQVWKIAGQILKRFSRIQDSVWALFTVWSLVIKISHPIPLLVFVLVVQVVSLRTSGWPQEF